MTPVRDGIVLEARGLEKRYGAGAGAVAALRGVDLALEAGEWVAVTGPSGGGKSTLLHLLAGLDRPTGGEVWVRGERVDGLDEAGWARLRRRSFGFVFQSFHLLATLTALENAALPARMAGMAPADALLAARTLLDRLGVAHRADALPPTLSGGEQQRVGLARALVNRPAVVLADEPTGALDSRNGREVLGLLREVHAAGQAILMVTHDSRVAAAADRVVRLRDGVVAGETALVEAAR